MASKWLRFLTLSQIQRLHARFVVPNAVPTQPDMLESAAHSPMNLRHYANTFQDGNKRTALLAADMFLKTNGYYLQEVPLKKVRNPPLPDMAASHILQLESVSVRLEGSATDSYHQEFRLALSHASFHS